MRHDKLTRLTLAICIFPLTAGMVCEKGESDPMSEGAHWDQDEYGAEPGESFPAVIKFFGEPHEGVVEVSVPDFVSIVEGDPQILDPAAVTTFRSC